jgi:hypothetical protein
MSRVGERGCVYRLFVGKTEERRPLGRSRRRCEDNIKIDLKEIGCVCMNWIELAQYRNGWWALVNAVMKFRGTKMRGIS